MEKISLFPKKNYQRYNRFKKNTHRYGSKFLNDDVFFKNNLSTALFRVFREKKSEHHKTYSCGLFL